MTRDARQWWQPPDGPSGPEMRLEPTRGERGRNASDPRRQVASCRRNQPVGTNGSYHSARKGCKHQKPLGGGPVSEPEWTRPEVGLAEEYGWRRQQTDWYYIGVRGAHRDQFNRASRTNCQHDSQPSPKPAGCPEKELTPRSKCRAPSAGSECSDSICESTTGTCTRG